MDDIETGNNVADEFYSSLVGMVALESVGLVLSVVAFIIILVAGIKLFRHKPIPGVGLIFYSLIGTLIGVIFYGLYPFLVEEGGSYLLYTLFDIVLAILFLMGAIGFWRLVKYVISKNAGEETS